MSTMDIAAHAGAANTEPHFALRELLQRLASDDAFRASMEGDPAGTLAAAGFVLDADVSGQVELPSREAIGRALEELGLRFEGRSGWIVFCK
jgi:putative modified peptide